MNDLIKNYIGKDCVIYSSGLTTITGIIEEINENWISVRTAEGLEVLNLDYVNRIKEYPLNKKGKKKLIVG